jgi:tetratricopeptide (TPR) repeat protein
METHRVVLRGLQFSEKVIITMKQFLVLTERLLILSAIVIAIGCVSQAIIYYNRGNDYLHEGDYDRALENYNKAIELDPDIYQVYGNRGNIYDVKGEYEKAIADQTKALEINPRDGRNYYNRAVSYYHEKQYDKALDDTLKAQQLGFEVNPEFLYELRKATGKNL